MAGRRDKTQEDARFRVLRLLEENPEMSQRNLAQAVGISLGSLHYCLTALVEKGLVVIGNFTAAEDKRRYAYVLTPKGLSERATLTRHFLKRKRAEYQALKVEIETLQEELELGAEMKPSPSGKSRQSH
jgi:EPS-associated MarR family transcriptional regulator